MMIPSDDELNNRFYQLAYDDGYADGMRDAFHLVHKLMGELRNEMRDSLPRLTRRTDPTEDVEIRGL